MKLPAGAVLDFSLRWRFKDIENFPVTLSGSSRKFKKTFTTKFDTSVHGLFLRAQLYYDKQPKAVKAYIDKHRERFFPGKGPWIYNYGNQRINLGTEADIKKQNQEVKDFFKRHLEAVTALENKLTAQIRLAAKKEAFHQGDKFDAKAWQAWLEKEIRDPIRKLQRENAAARKDLKFLANSRDIEIYLPRVNQIMARRSYENSKKLYQRLGLPVSKEDKLPKDIHTNAKRFKKKDLVKWQQSINDSLELGLKFGK